MTDFDLLTRLEQLAAEYELPGAAAAILFDGEVVEACTGVANIDTGLGVTSDTIFQIGSITKVYTATLVMQLVDDGKVELDTPITRYLPEVRFGDPSVNDVLTVRQFLTHTSGLEGDYFAEFGRGDDCIERYVASLAELPQLHAPGENLSYCNSGWVLLGRLVERLTGEPYHAAFASKLTGPGGLADTVVLAEDAILRRVAVGHVPAGPDSDELHVAPVWTLGHASAPAGSLTCATAADVIRFARIHLDDGRAADGTQVLSPASVKAMQQPQADIPDRYTLADAWGLGWFVMDWPGVRGSRPPAENGKRVIGHDGTTIGQAAFLRVCPEAGLAVTLLTNGGKALAAYRALFAEVFAEYAGVTMPSWPSPLDDPSGIDLEPYVGRFVRHEVTLDVRLEDGKLTLAPTMHGRLAELSPEEIPPAELEPAGDDVFLVTLQGRQLPVVFYRPDDDGRPSWIHFGARAHRREE